jgi:predicted ATPase
LSLRSVTVLECFGGVALHYGDGITYWPVVEVLLELGHDPQPVIAGSPAEAQLAFRKLLEEEAALQPLVVYFDDLQWAEPTFLDLVEHIADWSRDAPTFLLCAARPDLLDLRPAWGGGKLNASSLLLESLSPDESGILVEQLLEQLELDELVRARIVEAAEGNPLFVEEMVAMVREDGGDEEIIVPPTIYALLQARLDRLGGDERTVIERGAVEGKIFHRGAVLELAPEPVRPSVGTHLLGLVRKELIRPEQATLPGDDAFRFRHLLIRDAAYESVPKETRARLHERFAAWLDTHAHLIEQDEIAGYHLEQAARYADEIGSPNPSVAERAFRRLAAAGLAAFNRSDWNAARSLLRRALALVPVGHPARVGVLPDYYVALLEVTDWKEARAVVTELRASPDERSNAYAQMFEGELELVSIRSPSYTFADLEEATVASVKVFERLGDEKGLAYAFRIEAFGRWAALRFAEAIEKFETAAESAARAGLQHLEEEARRRIAIAHVTGPTPVPETIELLERFAEEHADRPLSLATSRGALARALASSGEIDAARELEDAELVLLEAGMELEATSVYNTRAWVAHCSGDFEEEVRIFEAMAVRLEELDDRAYLSTTYMELGICLAGLGRDEEAQRALERAHQLTSSDDVIDVIGLAALGALLTAHRGEFDDARLLAHRALDRVEETDDLPLRLKIRLIGADVLQRAGQSDEASALLEESVELADRHGHVVLARRARERLAALA